METSYEIFEKIKELKPFLRSEYSVKEIGLFGSYSDDSYNNDSDIDILVELERPIGWKFLTLEIYLEKIFNKKIDLITKDALKEQIRDSIIEQVRFV
jgi:predicted nucleotidyltransferase